MTFRVFCNVMRYLPLRRTRPERDRQEGSHAKRGVWESHTHQQMLTLTSHTICSTEPFLPVRITPVLALDVAFDIVEVSFPMHVQKSVINLFGLNLTSVSL